MNGYDHDDDKDYDHPCDVKLNQDVVGFKYAAPPDPQPISQKRSAPKFGLVHKSVHTGNSPSDLFSCSCSAKQYS